MTKKVKRIIGIDPGTNIMGYAVIEVFGEEVKMLNVGVFKLQKFETQQEKLKEIYLQTQEIIESYIPDQMAIEAPFFGKNVQSMLKLGRAQGVAMAAAITMGLDITEYSPKKIKKSITGNGNASKEQVSSMLERILNTKLNSTYLDASDALATAMCHYYQNGKPASDQKQYKNWASYISENKNKIVG
jgi:crossover junction endodeoxyribonuclease RuvC